VQLSESLRDVTMMLVLMCAEFLVREAGRTSDHAAVIVKSP
jgi:hypothetical protein